jgi:glycosyltransferase involved in cell wall biosynthesis
MHKHKLKILHLLSQRPDSTGSGIYVQAMIREAALNGFDNFLVAGLCSSGCDDNVCITPDRSMFLNFHNADVSYRIPGMSDVMPYDSSRFCDLSAENLNEYETAFSGLLKKAVEQFRPDIIHSHHLWIVSSLARRLFPHIPMVTTCHGSDLRQFQNCGHLQERVLQGCRKIDAVMALSRAQKDEIVRLYNIAADKIVVIGAGYNDSLFYAAAKSDPDPVQLVYAGKLSSAKGVPWLLRSLGSIRSPAWQLHLLGSGSGEEKELCLRLAGELGDKVIVHGALPQENLAEILRQSHILVLPSFFEGLPLVILEGLASGCRVVATDLPGARELIGSTDAGFITLVPTPRLRYIDQPYEEDEPLFEEHLTKALQQQIDAASRSAQLDLSPIRKTLDAYTWTGIFKKVREVYLKFSP